MLLAMRQTSTGHGGGDWTDLSGAPGGKAPLMDRPLEVRIGQTSERAAGQIQPITPLILAPFRSVHLLTPSPRPEEACLIVPNRARRGPSTC